LCAQHGGAAFTDWREGLARTAPGIVVASTTNAHLMPIALAALAQGAHVLIEKPMGRNAGEARAMADAARASGRVLQVGFNHRFHPAIRKALTLARSGTFGRVLFARCTYGHGGRKGYEKEWRGSRDECGGGELLDQGVHVLDLFQALLGRPTRVHCELGTFAWPIAPLEDNAFALLRYGGGQVATFHTSWTQWKNRFELQIYCDEGSLEVAGLGGSYGTETLTIARRRHEGGAPALWTESFAGPDRSWEDEWDELVRVIGNGGPGNAGESLQVMETLAELYRSADRLTSS
jgi:predicted dehydrogenase